LLQHINHRGTNRIVVLSLDLFTIYVVRLYGILKQRVKYNKWPKKPTAGPQPICE